ncbi:multiheme c-type cytochrome, partial [Bacteroidota bacterium]
LLNFLSNNLADDPPKFVGTKTCAMCHKKEKDGEQLKIWGESKHANAFKTLQTVEADKIAKEKGVGDKAAESEACLKCHVSGYNVDSTLIGKKFKIEDGVQCETCHGPGEKYKSKKTMQNHTKAVANGMTDFSKKKDIEVFCKTCHNVESPTFTEFNFKERWGKIKHYRPEK